MKQIRALHDFQTEGVSKTKTLGYGRSGFEVLSSGHQEITFGALGFQNIDKGQLISKAIYGLLTSPKKRTDEFDLFAVKSKKANKSNSSVRFLGEVS